MLCLQFEDITMCYDFVKLSLLLFIIVNIFKVPTPFPMSNLSTFKVHLMFFQHLKAVTYLYTVHTVCSVY